MIENINNTPQDSGQGDNLYVATTKINNNFDYIQGILNDVLTTGSTISISQVSGLQAALDSINNELANIPTILQDIVDINTAITSINNTLNSQNISITELLADVVDLQSQINLKVDEAPIDGLQYARQNGSWTVVSGGTGGSGSYLPLSGGTMYSGATINFANGYKIGEAFYNQGFGLTSPEGYEWKIKVSEVFLTDVNTGYIILKQFSSTIPLPTNDITEGFTVGSYWFGVDGSKYYCSDSSAGAAVWEQQYILGNLQQITDIGNSTTNQIVINSDVNGLYLDNGSSYNNLILATGNTLTFNDEGIVRKSIIDNQTLVFVKDSTSKTISAGTYNTDENTVLILPDKAAGTYTLATTSDLTDRFTTGGTYNSSAGTITFTTNSGSTYAVTGITTPFTGGTVSGETIFTNGLTANTISATTYENIYLDGLSDVVISAATNNQVLSYTSATEIWQNKNILDLVEDFNRTQGIYYFEEFMGQLNANVITSVNSIHNVVANGQGTTRSTTSITNKTIQQGVIESLTNANSTGTAGFGYGSGQYKGSGSITMETYFNITTLSTLAERFFTIFGWITGSNLSNPANAILITYDEGGVVIPYAGGTPNFRCITRGGSTITNTISSVPVVAGQWYKLKINISSDGGTVTFFIDDTLVATHSTNLPLNTTAIAPISIIAKSSGTAARAMQTDYFMYKQIFTTPR